MYSDFPQRFGAESVVTSAVEHGDRCPVRPTGDHRRGVRAPLSPTPFGRRLRSGHGHLPHIAPDG
jgi:hypothetical protein